MHCGGIPTRVMPHTAELQPEAFVEVSPELARELGIRHLGWTVISTLRGEIEVRAMVTERVRPFTIDGRTVHQIGMPWVFGRQGYARGAIANVLLAITGDANTSIHTTKALTCGLRPGGCAARGCTTMTDRPGAKALQELDKVLAAEASPRRRGVFSRHQGAQRPARRGDRARAAGRFCRRAQTAGPPQRCAQRGHGRPLSPRRGALGRTRKPELARGDGQSEEAAT